MAEEQTRTVEPEVREHLIYAMRKFFSADGRRQTHALKVLEFAEQLLLQEPGDPTVVAAGALLYNIGIPRAEAKYGSHDPKYQEAEAPPQARKALGWYSDHFTSDQVEHICKIVGHHHSPKAMDTPEFRIVWDAHWLVNLPSEFPLEGGIRLTSIISRTFKTKAGRELAEKLYL